MKSPFDGLLRAAGLLDLVPVATDGRPFSRDALTRVLDAANPLAAAALADLRRRETHGVSATHPWTVRVRAPGVTFPTESPTMVSHQASALEGIDATEAQLVVPPGAALELEQAVEMLATVRAARPDLPVRAFTASELRAMAARSGSSLPEVIAHLSRVGLATLSWAPGSDEDPATIDVHRAAHEGGVPTVVPIAYGKDSMGAALLDRIHAVQRLAEETGKVLAAIPLPDRVEGASPLEGTAGTEDMIVFALVRLGLGQEVPHVTVDAHVLGHKLAALLLSAGATDVVGAQTATTWVRPTDDGPRPLNPDRMRAYLVEARRSPVRRDALFRLCDPSP